MSLDVVLINGSVNDSVCVFDSNLTHNLGRMAEEACLYHAIWRPDAIGANRASEITDSLVDGLRFMKRNRDSLSLFNPDNGCGCFDDLERFVESYLIACLVWPDAEISVYR